VPVTPAKSRFYCSWLILSNIECTFVRRYLLGSLFFLQTVPLNALSNWPRFYWCITGVNDTGDA
jgi:hypothetical protein